MSRRNRRYEYGAEEDEGYSSTGAFWAEKAADDKAEIEASRVSSEARRRHDLEILASLNVLDYPHKQPLIEAARKELAEMDAENAR